MMIRRQFIETPGARIHLASAGSGSAILLLHQTPRSWQEYKDILPTLGERFLALAMDTAGFGDSTPLPAELNSIEAWAACAFDLLDALDIKRVALVGHHTGAAVAIEMAAARPERIQALILSSPPFVDEARRLRSAGRPAPVDEAERSADGHHLSALWALRRPLYPEGRTDLLDQYILDALKAGPLLAGGHHVVNRYVMEPQLAKIACPTLVIAASEDPYAKPTEVAQSIAGSRLVTIQGGMVPLPDQMPVEFANAIATFLSPMSPW